MPPPRRRPFSNHGNTHQFVHNDNALICEPVLHNYGRKLAPHDDTLPCYVLSHHSVHIGHGLVVDRSWPYRRVCLFEGPWLLYGIVQFAVGGMSYSGVLCHVLYPRRSAENQRAACCPYCLGSDGGSLLAPSGCICNSISALTIKPWLGAERLLLVSDLNTNKTTTTITSGLRRLGFYMDHRVTGSCWRDSWA